MTGKIVTGIVTEIETVTEKGRRKRNCEQHLTLRSLLLGYHLWNQQWFHTVLTLSQIFHIHLVTMIYWKSGYSFLSGNIKRDLQIFWSGISHLYWLERLGLVKQHRWVLSYMMVQFLKLEAVVKCRGCSFLWFLKINCAKASQIVGKNNLNISYA